MTKISDVEVVRLKALADLLDDVPEKDFDLATWVGQEPREAVTKFFGLVEVAPACGFAGCAVGWAIHSRLFPQLGFTPSLSDDEILVPAMYSADGEMIARGWDAVEKIFGISDNMAHFLFMSDRYKVRASTEMVANRLRRLAAKVEAIRARERRKAVNSVLPDSLKKLVQIPDIVREW